MPSPFGFSWVAEPVLAASARPEDPSELRWLRDKGVQLVVSLTETPLRRDWINDAGLFNLHVPVPDMEAPTLPQIERVVAAIQRAGDQGMGVLIHCAAGLGRTGTMLAAVFVQQGDKPGEAIRRVRRLRPGSVETPEQEQAIEAYARRVGSG